jgi:hypothetical protein
LQTLLVTSSIIFESGSTKFGDTADDTHQFTGSLSVLGNVSSSVGFSGSGANITNSPNSGLVNSSVTVNGTAISLGGSGTVTAAAGTLSGNTLASGVTASSLTSVGTLSSLSVSGDANLATSSGAVGIGTSTIPSNVKTVVTSPNTAVNSRGNFYVYTTDTATTDYGAQLTLGGSFSGTSEAPFAAIAGRYSGGTTGYMQFGVLDFGNIVEKMRITSAGNVGIGVTGPEQKLHISGTSVGSDASQTNISAFVNNGIRITGNLDSAAQDAITYRAGSGGGAALAFGRNAGFGTYIAFYTNNTASVGAISERMRIDSAGNVGIGTTSISSRLTVRIGTANASAMNVQATTGNNLFNFISNDTTGHGILDIGRNTESGTYLPAHIRLRTDGDSWIQGGSVGIGTASPTTRLEALNAAAGSASDWLTRLVTANQGISTANRIYTAFDATDGTNRAAAIGYGYDGSGYFMSLGTSASTAATPTEHVRITAGGVVQVTTSGTSTRIATKATSVSTSATTISFIATGFGQLVMVTGIESPPGNIYSDLLFVSTTAGATVLSAKSVSGSPASRTYTLSGSDELQLAMGSGTYDVRCIQYTST